SCRYAACAMNDREDVHHSAPPYRVPLGLSDELFKPTFKGSACSSHFLELRTLHTTRGRDRAHHRPPGDRVGPQRSACPLDYLSIIGPVRLVQTRLTPPLPSGLQSCLCDPG